MKTSRTSIFVLISVVAIVSVGLLAGRSKVLDNHLSGSALSAGDPSAPASDDLEGPHLQPRPGQRAARDDVSVQRTIRRAIAEQGPESADVRSMLLIATTTCSGRASSKQGNNPANWATRYIDLACTGFDPSEFSYLEARVDVNTVKKNKGESAATEFALAKVRDHDEEFSSRVISGWYLIENGEFPNREAYALDDEGLARAFSGAIGLELCRQLNACSSRSLMTAGLCESMNCRPGINYAEALKLRLTGAEFQSAVAIAGKLTVGEL